MTTSQLQRHLTHFRAQLLAHEQQANAAIEQAYAHVLATIQPRLNALYDQMVNELGKSDKIPISWLYEANRLEALKQFLSGQIDHFGALSLIQAGQMQRVGVRLGQQAGQALLEATLPIGVRWTFGMPSPKAIAELVGMTQAGSPLADLFRGFGTEAAENVGKALIRGVTLGDNPRKVAADVQDALGVSRARALTISRQEMLRCYKSANLETYRANDDTVDQWRWTADKSGRTCAVCISMDGSLHDLSEDMESHVQCRCAPVPVTKSWEDILGPLGIDVSSIPETGQYDYQSGTDWFDKQDAATQQSILGSKAAYAAYKDGELSLKDLVGKSYSSDWGGSRYQKSLKDAIGAKKASKYYGK